MAQLLVRDLKDEAKERLRVRAKRNGRSLEAEARCILEEVAVQEPLLDPVDGQGFGSQMAALFKDVGLTEPEKKAFDKTVARLRKSRLRVPKFGE